MKLQNFSKLAMQFWDGSFVLCCTFWVMHRFWSNETLLSGRWKILAAMSPPPESPSWFFWPHLYPCLYIVNPSCTDINCYQISLHPTQAKPSLIPDKPSTNANKRNWTAKCKEWTGGKLPSLTLVYIWGKGMMCSGPDWVLCCRLHSPLWSDRCPTPVELTLGDGTASGISTTTYTTSPWSKGRNHTLNRISYQATGKNRP